jgi:hypothetical protein
MWGLVKWTELYQTYEEVLKKMCDSSGRNGIKDLHAKHQNFLFFNNLTNIGNFLCPWHPSLCIISSAVFQPTVTLSMMSYV